ncbi:MAG TPA: amidohydrolase family protein, partial [Gemmatimonadales bacterium]|nr:amidohydrolase family protein [Gemmatimonadales bacterium]
MPAVRLAARWVLPVDGPPIAAGAVLIGADGRVAAIGPDASVPAPPGVPQRPFPDGAIAPGFVNVHTHLELSGFEGQVEDDDFAGWIRRLRELKDRRSRDEYRAAARRGIRDAWAMGVTTVADTGDRGVVLEALAECGGSGVVYQEVFGPHPDQLETSLRDLKAKVAEQRGLESERLRLGVSPHAPYTVSAPLYRAVSGYARSERLPIAVHLAESPAETQLLRAAAGPFADAWGRRGIPLPPLPGRSPVAWLDAQGVLGPETLCIHLVQVDAEDVGRLAGAGVAVAHCPGSNRRHGHGVAPLRQLRAAGLRVGVGTDSVASVASVDLRAEARAARALAELSWDNALALVTYEGAKALGLERQVGT